MTLICEMDSIRNYPIQLIDGDGENERSFFLCTKEGEWKKVAEVEADFQWKTMQLSRLKDLSHHHYAKVSSSDGEYFKISLYGRILGGMPMTSRERAYAIALNIPGASDRVLARNIIGVCEPGSYSQIQVKTEFHSFPGEANRIKTRVIELGVTKYEWFENILSALFSECNPSTIIILNRLRLGVLGDNDPESKAVVLKSFKMNRIIVLRVASDLSHIHIRMEEDRTTEVAKSCIIL